MTEKLEQVMQQLLIPDNDGIKNATVEIKQLMKDPGIVQALCTLMTSSQHTQVRQYSAVLLRKLVLTKKQWNAVDTDTCRAIRQNLLRVTLAEQDKSAQKSLTQVVATIAKHDLPTDRWPELFQFLEMGIKSHEDKVREVAMFILSSVASAADQHLNKQVPAILRLAGTTLDDPASHMVVYHTLVMLTHLVPSAGTQSLKPWQMLVPKMLNAVKRLAAVDQGLAAQGLEVFDELIDTEVPILQPHLQTFLQFCLETAQNQALDEKLIMKALSFIAAVSRQKKKMIIKLNLIAPILDVLFPIMCRPPQSDVDGHTEHHDCADGCDDSESHTPDAVAAQVVDTMALHLPPEKFISALMKYVQPAFDSQDAYVRRAAFIALAVSSEGCGDNLKTKHLDKLLPRVYAGMTDVNAEVRNSALYTLGQFSEHLQPNIAKHSAVLLPLLFACLQKTSDGTVVRRKDVIRTYYAVEMFCESLGTEIVPYLDSLLSFLLNAIDSSPSGEVKELAISAISAAASAAKEDLVPFFPRIQTSLARFLNPTEDEDQLKIQLQALEALGVLAQTLGEHFRPLAVDCINLGLGLLGKTTDPDLRRCIYSLFAAVSTILKNEMAPYMNMIVPKLIECVKSVEGITPHYDNDMDKQFLAIFDESGDGDAPINGNGMADVKDEDDDEDEDDDDAARVESLDIQTPLMDEKEDACAALGTIAKSTGALFLPYIEEAFKETTELLEYPVADVRQAAIQSICEYCCAVGRLVDSLPAGTTDQESLALQTGLTNMLSATVPRFIKMVREDEEREVAMTVLESLNEMLKTIKGAVLKYVEGAGAGSPGVILDVVREVIQRKVKCQADDDVEELEEDEAEIDSMLIENAGDILPTLAQLLGGAIFSPFFAGLVPELTKKLKKSASIPERSFAIGVFAETLEKMGPASASFVGRLYPVFTNAVADEDEEVRNNAIYGLGVLAANGGPEAAAKYPHILALLTKTMSTELDERVRDNVCGAICRMISANVSLVDVAAFFPSVADRLPLRTDLEENATVFRCIGDLYALRHDQVLVRLPRLLEVIGGLLSSTEISADLRSVLVGVAIVVGQRDPAVMASVVQTTDARVSDNLRSCLQLTPAI